VFGRVRSGVKGKAWTCTAPQTGEGERGRAGRGPAYGHQTRTPTAAARRPAADQQQPDRAKVKAKTTSQKKTNHNPPPQKKSVFLAARVCA